MGRLQPCDTPAFLVNEHRRIGASDALTQVGDEPSDLRRALAVPLEKNEAEGVGVAEEVALGGRERGAGAAEDDSGGVTA